MGKQFTSEEEGERLTARLRPDSLGRLFGKMAVAGASSFMLSFFSIFAWALVYNPPDGASLPLPITVVGISSWACLLVSLFGYVIWASQQIRNRPQDPDLYEKRKRLMHLALGFGILTLLAPIGILFGGIRTS